MKKERNPADFLLGIIVFALGGTVLLSLVLSVLTGATMFQFYNLTEVISAFVGMLMLATGLLLLIRAAMRDEKAVAALVLNVLT